MQWITKVLVSSQLKFILITDLVKDDIFKLLSPLLPFTTSESATLSIIFESGNCRTVPGDKTLTKKDISGVSKVKKSNSANKNLSAKKQFEQSSFDEVRQSKTKESTLQVHKKGPRGLFNSFKED